MTVNPLIPGARPHLAVKIKRPGERRSLSRTATRALDLMELFGTSRGALRAVDIGRALGVTPSTTNQLLKTMVDSGHLVFDARSKGYLPSPRLARFGGWIADVYGPTGRLRDFIEGIREELGMVVTISTPNDLFMQIIDSAIPEGQSAERGLRVSLFGSAIGNACLSALDDAEIERLGHRARISEAEMHGVRSSVATVRKDGFAQGPSIDDRIWSIALPLPVAGLPGPAVLGLAGTPEDLRPRISELVERMRRAVEDYREAS